MKHPEHNHPDEGMVKPFLDHLEDLRVVLIRTAIAIVAGMVVAFPLTPKILGILKRPLYTVTSDPDHVLQSLEVSGAFVSAMQMAFWSGLLICFPALVFIIGSFVLPALKPNEKKLAAQAGIVGGFLFIFGVVFGYIYTLPFALSAMYMFNDWLGVSAMWTLTSYVAFTTQLLAAFGLAFEIPMILLILGRMGIVSGEWLRLHRRHAVVAALTIACILTPPDVVSQIIMTIPLVLMYEGCIWIVLAWDRKKAVAAGIADDNAPVNPSGDQPS
jgi:sec-independent protein translocase protein TatC